MLMIDEAMLARVSGGPGFFAALDQSGGSMPDALRAYGIADSAYKNEDEMFALMHDMRVRIITAPAFTASSLVAAILFEHTIESAVGHRPMPEYLWQERHVVPFLKIDQGLDAERDGVRLMRPMPRLDSMLTRANELGIFGTKMRSVISEPSKEGIAAILAQQFEFAARILQFGMMPIIEPEVLAATPDKDAAEVLLRDELKRQLDALSNGQKVILKLAIPETPNLYCDFVGDERVLRLLALSGGQKRQDACDRLTRNIGMTASFGRALTEDLSHAMDLDQINAVLAASVDQIYEASITKQCLN
jgi:fructose-bisphosphate aldolase, class I